MKPCFWCNTDPDEAAQAHEGPHATWCPHYAGVTANWPPDPPELQGLNQEERRFYRLIEKREANDDGSQKITLACGHESVQVIPIPDSLNYMQCAQCVNVWVTAARRAQ